MNNPGKISFYFRKEWRSLTLVTVTGLIYNVGLLAGPLYEGKLVQCLLDILNGKKQFRDMLVLALSYLLVIAIVQTARFLKRLFVRKFANNTNRRMKQTLYRSLVYSSREEIARENAGVVMTKAVSDADACAEGMRKFTTEVFDTGVALLGYILLLLSYDWKIALCCLVFTPASYFIAEKMKVVVQKANSAYKKSSERLSLSTLDRVQQSITYRVYGCEGTLEKSYEADLCDYEKKAVRANVFVQSMPPIYHIITMLGVIFILYFGSGNVSSGIWDIAMFTTFLSCFAKLAVKSSKVAKLFNSVQKAEVSWKRIQNMLHLTPDNKTVPSASASCLSAENLSFPSVFSGLSFSARRGQIIGITGPVAAGKSVLGRVLMGELNYEGSLTFDGRELSGIDPEIKKELAGYMGHTPELFSDTVENNVLLGKQDDVWTYLKLVRLSDEISEMPLREKSLIGSGGILLSGGQKARLILARTLAHPRPVYVLDDPFAALDRKTEEELFAELRSLSEDPIIFLISHRLYLFPQMDGVIWMADGKARMSDHSTLMKEEARYRDLYVMQAGGESEAQE